MERLVYEGFAPHRVPVIVECLSDNVNRTKSSMNVLFRKGQLGAEGSVSWDFSYVSVIEATPNSKDADVEVAAIEAGAQDFEPADEEGTALFITEVTDLDAVCEALPAQGFNVVSAKLGFRPRTPSPSVTISSSKKCRLSSKPLTRTTTCRTFSGAGGGDRPRRRRRSCNVAGTLLLLESITASEIKYGYTTARSKSCFAWWF